MKPTGLTRLSTADHHGADDTMDASLAAAPAGVPVQADARKRDGGKGASRLARGPCDPAPPVHPRDCGRRGPDEPRLLVESSRGTESRAGQPLRAWSGHHAARGRCGVLARRVDRQSWVRRRLGRVREEGGWEQARRGFLSHPTRTSKVRGTIWAACGRKGPSTFGRALTVRQSAGHRRRPLRGLPSRHRGDDGR